MTSTVTRIAIGAPARNIYALASATERWPILLPHYRFVRVLSVDGDVRTVEMAAVRGKIPIRWVAEQRNDPRTPAIYFRHTAGWTKGMEVVWRFAQRGEETIVTIEHDLDFNFPIAAGFIEKHVIADYFIDGVAKKTLAQFKRLAEENVAV
jgi:ribosome-associated toxin RatA of RatAB toxin-antitoxin module